MSSFRQFVAINRDYAANPRTAQYQWNCVGELLRTSELERADAFVDTGWPADVLKHCPDGIAKAERRRLADLQASDIADCDTVVFVYPDPLGLSWQTLESRLSRSFRSMVVLNGRHRLFTLDARARRALCWRRFLAETRVVELAAALLILPIAGTFACRDFFRGLR